MINRGYRDFYLKYNEKIKNDKDIKENQLDFFRDFRPRISFNVNVFEGIPIATPSFGYNGQNLFTLDSEDLEYLYNKYSKKTKAEMELNIAKIKDSYRDTL